MERGKYLLIIAIFLTISPTWGQDFTATFDTRLGADPTSYTIKLPISNGTYDVDFDNDEIYEDYDFNGTYLNNLEGTVTIAFNVAGVHTIRIRPSSSNTSNQLRIAFAGANSAQKLTSIDSWGTSIVWTSMRDAFHGCGNMNILATAGAPNLSMATDLTNAFYGASSFNGDIKGWNVSTIIHMNNVFRHATSFNQDISTWNVSNVTNMFLTFYGATAFNQPLNDWDVSGVENFPLMFYGATAFNQPLDKWNVSSGTNMAVMFSDATSFNQDISNWNVSNVTNMNKMFKGAIAFDQSLGSWNVSNVDYMNDMFTGATSFGAANYVTTLTGWLENGVQDGVAFGAPPVQVCFDSDVRENLINSFGWVISGDTCLLSLNIKAFLHGAHHIPSGMMRSDLSAHIPTTSPYSDRATINPEVLNVTGHNAIVDWVFVELRDKNDFKKTVYTSSALLQRDGNVVGLDGVSLLKIEGAIDEYHVVLKHRIHIPIITNTTVSLSGISVSQIDFTNASNVRGGTTSLQRVDTNTHALMCGDLNGDGQINTADLIVGFKEMGKSGYSSADINMDGQVQTLDMINMLVPFLGSGIQF